MADKKKIAFITPFYIPADLTGSSIIVKQLAESLAKIGYDVSVVTSMALTRRYWYDPFFSTGLGHYSRINGVKVYRLDCDQFISAFYYVIIKYFKFLLPETIFNKFLLRYRGPNLKGLSKFLRANRFDVIHSSPMPFYLNKQVADIIPVLTYKPEFILRAEAHLLRPEYKNPELKGIYERADKIVVLTEYERDSLRRVFKIPYSKLSLINNGVDLGQSRELEILKHRVKKYLWAKKLKGKKIIFFAGTKSPYKGAITLLETVNELHESDDSYLLVTIGEDTREWRRAKIKVDRNCFIDLGFVNEKQKNLLFSLCDIYCMPSVIEAFGLAYLDAWAKKKPVIAAETGVSQEIVVSAKGGITVEFNNKSQLKRAIKFLISNPVVAKKMGENGYRALGQKYSFKRMIKKYEAIF